MLDTVLQMWDNLYMSDFSIGQQPCENYQPMMTYAGDRVFANVHECFCGHSVGKTCGKLVSFCESCNRDHHECGYETCQCHGNGFE